MMVFYISIYLLLCQVPTPKTEQYVLNNPTFSTEVNEWRCHENSFLLVSVRMWRISTARPPRSELQLSSLYSVEETAPRSLLDPDWQIGSGSTGSLLDVNWRFWHISCEMNVWTVSASLQLSLRKAKPPLWWELAQGILGFIPFGCFPASSDPDVTEYSFSVAIRKLGAAGSAQTMTHTCHCFSGAALVQLRTTKSIFSE